MTHERQLSSLTSVPAGMHLERVAAFLKMENAYLHSRVAELEAGSDAPTTARLEEVEREVERLRQAESDVRRLIGRLSTTPFVSVFRRWPGFRVMEERWGDAG